MEKPVITQIKLVGNFNFAVVEKFPIIFLSNAVYIHMTIRSKSCIAVFLSIYKSESCAQTFFLSYDHHNLFPTLNSLTSAKCWITAGIQIKCNEIMNNKVIHI